MSNLSGPPIAQRDVRARVYLYEEGGSDGRTSPEYHFSSESWVSMQAVGNADRDVGSAPQFEASVIFGFHEGIAVAERAVIVAKGLRYRVTAIPDQQTQVPGRVRQVYAIRADREVFTLQESP